MKNVKKYQFSQKLALNAISLPKIKQTVKLPTHHIAVIDCSGSMSGQLDQIRDQLKTVLPKIIKKDDLFSLIWFSGRNEYGVLLKAEPLPTLIDLKGASNVIDRWIQPMGATGFVGPLNEATSIIDTLGMKKYAHSLFFMSDGQENQWTAKEVCSSVESLAKKLSASTIVEYGYCADKRMLATIAELTGGTLLFAKDFNKYAPQFEAAIINGAQSSEKVLVEVNGETALNNLAYAIDGENLLTFFIEGNKVFVPEHIKEIYTINQSCSNKTVSTDEMASALYAGMAIYAQRMNSPVVWDILACLGDVSFIEEYSSCFGKQKYVEFVDRSTKVATTNDGAYVDGKDLGKVPNSNAFTALDLLKILSENEYSLLLTNHPSFQYNRISQARDNDGPDGIKLKFSVDEKSKQGIPIHSLTYHESRPNISIKTISTGSVDLSLHMPQQHKDRVPTVFETHIYRNYSVICDGIINTDTLPCKVSTDTLQLLIDKGLPQSAYKIHDCDTESNYRTVEFKMDRLPVINRSMVTEVSAKELFQKEYDLTKWQAKQKVYRHYLSEMVEKVSENFELKYGKEATQWLSSVGLTERGFAPTTKARESTDEYTAKKLHVLLKGLSSLPSVNEARKKIKEGKNTVSIALMEKPLAELDLLVSSLDKEGLKVKLTELNKEATDKTRVLLQQVSQVKFAVVLGQIWFKEFASLDENNIDLTFEGKTLNCKVEMQEESIRL